MRALPVAIAVVALAAGIVLATRHDKPADANPPPPPPQAVSTAR